MSPAPAVRRGRPPAVTVDDIARAVVEVGFSDLTVAAVQRHLGVGQTTLFRHVRDRDGLVRLGLDLVLRGVEWPPPTGPWRTVLERYARTAWHAWAAHPGSAAEAARGLFPRSVIALNDELVTRLVRQGFAPSDAVLACGLVFELVVDSRRIAEQLDRAVPDTGPDRVRVADMWNESRSPDGHPSLRPTAVERATVHAAVLAALGADPLDWFVRKLRVLLDGIGHLATDRP